jgi:SAM-dependent methyltransferase
MKIVTALLMFAVGAPASIAQDAPPAATATPLRKPDVRYQPSPQKKVREMLDLAGVKPGDVVYDLGSGDGRIPIAAVADYGARGVGIDIDPKRIAEAEANARAAGVEGRVEYRLQDLFEADFSDATVVTLFLWPDINRKLRPKLMALRPGTRIVSYWHDMGDWKPDRTIDGGLFGGNIYLWTVPER